MMSYLNSRIIYSILFYVLLMILIVITKPNIMFEDDGNIKSFGIGDDKTMFSFGLFAILLAIISFYIFCMIDLIFK